MRKIWSIIDRLQWPVGRKNAAFLAVMIIMCAVAGGLLWTAAGRLILPGVDWMICFVGYPAFFAGLFGGIIYLGRHNFT